MKEVNKRRALYAEIQDRDTRQFVHGHIKDRTNAYKIGADAFDFSLDDKTPIQNRVLLHNARRRKSSPALLQFQANSGDPSIFVTHACVE